MTDELKLQLFEEEKVRIESELIALKHKYGVDSLVNGNQEVDDKWNETMAIYRIIRDIKRGGK